MNFEQIKELIKLVDSSDLAFFEISTNNEHIKMDKSVQRNVEGTAVQTTAFNNNIGKSAEIVKDLVCEQNEISKESEENISVEDSDLTVITSPMVGTYYSKPSPDSKEFVSCGDNITKGKVLCIIEAMKLMNEIESEFNGTVVECLIKDGDMVEYGQPLFKIKEA